MADPKSYIGALVQAVAATPATVDASGFAALTYSNTIGKIISVAGLGDSHSDVTVTLLGTGRAFHSNGAADGGEVAFSFAYDSAGDGGQQFILAQNGGNTNVSFKITDPDGKISYVYGVIRNFKDNTRDDKTMKGYSFGLGANSPTIRPSF